MLIHISVTLGKLAILESTGVLIIPWSDQEGKKLMFLSEWCEFPSAPCPAGQKT